VQPGPQGFGLRVASDLGNEVGIDALLSKTAGVNGGGRLDRPTLAT
jgi:hypothetical protein